MLDHPNKCESQKCKIVGSLAGTVPLRIIQMYRHYKGL